MDSCFFVPFMKICHSRQVSRVTPPVTQWGTDPKSSTYPPPKDRAAVLSRDRPMPVTTTAETTGAMIFRQYRAVRPRSPSKTPPTSTVPTTVPYPYLAAIAAMGTTKVKLTPMKMGRPDPTRPMGVHWIKVAMPATIMAFCTSTRTSLFDISAAATRPMGTRFVTNIARICCREKGSSFQNLTRPLSS